VPSQRTGLQFQKISNPSIVLKAPKPVAKRREGLKRKRKGNRGIGTSAVLVVLVKKSPWAKNPSAEKREKNREGGKDIELRVRREKAFILKKRKKGRIESLVYFGGKRRPRRGPWKGRK